MKMGENTTYTVYMVFLILFGLALNTLTSLNIYKEEALLTGENYRVKTKITELKRELAL